MPKRPRTRIEAMELIGQIRELADKGVPPREIAEQLGMPLSTIEDALDDFRMLTMPPEWDSAQTERPTPGASPEMIAAWMFEETRRKGLLYQSEAVHQIARQFGPEFIDNHCIHRDVLAAFRKLRGRHIKWILPERCWRWQRNGDRPGRLQL